MILYSLELSSSILDGQSFIGHLTNSAQHWRRSIRSRGGSWQGSFTLTGDSGDLPSLQDFFYTKLGCDLSERSGGVKTWQGMIYEMELSTGYFRRRRSLDLITNAVRTTYIDPANAVYTTAYATDQASIDRYGRKEDTLSLDGLSGDTANKQRDTFLKENAWPWARPVGGCTPGEPTLSVAVCGYIMTANFCYVSVTTELDSNQGVLAYNVVANSFDDAGGGQDFADWQTPVVDQPARYSIWVHNDDDTYTWAYCGPNTGAIRIAAYQDQALTTAGWNGTAPAGKTPLSYFIYGSISRWINDIITTDCEFLNVGVIDENVIQAQRALAINTRGWDVMSELTMMGDISANPWRLYVGADREVHFQQIDTEPLYYLRQGRMYDSAAGSTEPSPWIVQPGVIRDMMYPVRREEPGTPFLQDARDVWIEEVECGVDSGLSLKPSLFSEAELVAAQLAYARR